MEGTSLVLDMRIILMYGHLKFQLSNPMWENLKDTMLLLFLQSSLPNLPMLFPLMINSISEYGILELLCACRLLVKKSNIRNSNVHFFRSKFVCHGLVMFGSKKKLAMYGRRLIFFDTVAEDKSTVVNQPMTDDIYAFHVQFNNYYNNFVVVTK
jgi:hypothetical protein